MHATRVLLHLKPPNFTGTATSMDAIHAAAQYMKVSHWFASCGVRQVVLVVAMKFKQKFELRVWTVGVKLSSDSNSFCILMIAYYTSGCLETKARLWQQKIFLLFCHVGTRLLVVTLLVPFSLKPMYFNSQAILLPNGFFHLRASGINVLYV